MFNRCGCKPYYFFFVLLFTASLGNHEGIAQEILLQVGGVAVIKVGAAAENAAAEMGKTKRGLKVAGICDSFPRHLLRYVILRSVAWITRIR